MATPAENLLQACVENRRDAGVPVDRWADPVPLDACGVRLHLRPLTAVELANWYRWFRGADRTEQRRLLPAVTFALNVCDARGRRLFELADAERIAREYNPRVLAAVTTRAQALNGM